MAESTLWWIVTGILVALELTTGTFYLLMLAIGTMAGALAAHAGAGPIAQMVLAALLGGGAVVACYLVRRRRPGDPSARADRSVNLDVGETVQVDAWNADGTATIRYRGAQWTAVHRAGAPASPGPHRVVELVGSRLLVEPI
ncbi:NfeD family protein [Ottowia sp.]|jgi:membrane protein implicated in regulation of membrane protease activity|uniref:NfeD family protein n=1 Tax=Ottowia sp. TaxID=1898956 RepID=UPI0025DF80B2|nr:NfeD family protein [Ottowia sp.]MBK6612812.1 NfeD family protein [Ottowia sp.]MBK6748059.1 NfeD family protein [Ottowia sp.]